MDLTPADLDEYHAVLETLPTDTLPARAPLPAGSRMPLAPNPLFVGRGDELLQVAAALKRGNTTVALGQIVASTGLGGQGKTQLAVELVHRYGRYFVGGVFWLSFASADEVPLQVAACVGPDFEARPMEERVQRVKDAWQSAVPRLLVFDNCEDEALLDAWRPASGGCRVLVTTRRAHWSPTMGVTALPLALLPRADSIALLRCYRPDLTMDNRALDAIASQLGDLPLALHLAGSYLRAYRTDLSLDDYLAELRRPDIVQHASMLGAGLEDSVSPTHHVHGIAQTFALSLDRLDRERDVDRMAVALLARMACLAPGEPVPRDLLARTLEDVEPLERVDGLRRLAAVGLAEEGESWLRLHRLVAHFALAAELDDSAETAVEQALVHPGVVTKRPLLAALMPHLHHVMTTALSRAEDDRAASLCNAYANALSLNGEYTAARPLFERELSIRERVHGPDHPATASGLTSLAVNMQAQGDLTSALPLMERALQVRERALGREHLDTAVSLYCLASLLTDMGRSAASLPLVERALTIRECVLGADHPDTAWALSRVATGMADLGELAKAQPLYERSLETMVRLLGPEHPDTARGFMHLARLLRARGDLVSARPHLERALAIMERVLGPRHPDTAWVLNEMVSLLLAEGDPTTALLFCERALEIRERVLGPDHQDTATAWNSMARVLRAQGDLIGARHLFERALEMRERVLGADHPDTPTSMHGLARVLRELGDCGGARSLLERAVSIRERVLGPDHPYTVATKRALEELAAEGDGAGAPE